MLLYMETTSWRFRHNTDVRENVSMKKAAKKPAKKKAAKKKK